ncbi:phosphotransferase [Thalassococcus sp. BH17M4-6]|uniref:phosphotransferase n=1 Tax=Thalassococcus sp. BH17M4-6 TaxID=3413148 RepID=UPI003BE117D8
MSADRPDLSRWGVSAPLRPLPGGARNRVFRTVGLDRDLVFKSTRRSPEALKWLDPVQEAARVAGFHVPGLIPSLRGHLAESGWTAEPLIPGLPATRSDLAGLSPRITAFHLLTSALPQRPGFASAADLLSQDRGGDIDLSIMPTGLVTALRAAWRPILDHPTCAIHSDLNPGNVILTEDGPVLLDWDEARRDAPLFDLACLGPSNPVADRAAVA